MKGGEFSEGGGKEEEGRGEVIEKNEGRDEEHWGQEEDVLQKEGEDTGEEDSILETCHFTSLRHDGKCAAYINKTEANLWNCSTGLIFMYLSNAKDKNMNT